MEGEAALAPAPNLRLLCDGYGLDERRDLVERFMSLRSAQLHDRDEQRARRARDGIRWLERHREELEAWL